MYLSRHGHSLQFEVAETYGEEVTSIRKTADLWTRDVIAYLGPQETCVHEGRMAAAFNLPMISYVSKYGFFLSLFLIVFGFYMLPISWKNFFHLT